MAAARMRKAVKRSLGDQSMKLKKLVKQTTEHGKQETRATFFCVLKVEVRGVNKEQRSFFFNYQLPAFMSVQNQFPQ